ncbi:MAG: type II secretion system protein [bacterium]
MKQKSRGTTLVELLVVIAIIGIISLVVFPSYRGMRGQLLANRSANKLAQDIRRASELATSMQGFNGTVPGGYGVYFQQGNNFYLLYADTTPIGGNGIYNSTDGVVERIYIEDGVVISDLSSPNLSVEFIPPSPTVRIHGNNLDHNTATVTVSLTASPSVSKNILINNAGVVDIR